MRPTGITADRTQATLTVTWDAAAPTVVPFRVLSDMCPCELCETERTNTDPLKVLRPHSYELEAINAVGSYAVNIVWKGGCSYGIYSWDFLFALGRRYPAIPTEPAP